MVTRLIVAVPIAIIGCVLALVTGTVGAGIITPGQMCSAFSADPGLAPGVQGASLDEEQVTLANVIVTVGERNDWPTRAQIIAVATALQESRLRNVPPGQGHPDSVGPFQQRPSQGWGTAQELSDPEYAAAAFYRALIRVPHWERLSLSKAAQAVQNNATPRAFAKWEHLATTLVTAATAGTIPAQTASQSPAGTDDADPCIRPLADSGIGGSLIRADVVPVIAYAVEHLGDPYAWGADGPNSFDCSGLTMAAFRTIGIQLPHRSALQVRYGRPINWHTEPIQPGDLVFMRGSIPVQDYGHTGIAISATEWINAARSGTPVQRNRIPLARVQAVRRLIAP